jgi:ketosteroid isomerase-like protein
LPSYSDIQIIAEANTGRFAGQASSLRCRQAACEEDKVPGIDILEVAKQYLSRLSDGAEAEELDSFFAPDVIQEEFPNRLLPNGASRNLQAMKEARARGRALLKAERFELVDAVAGSDKVAMEVIWTGTVRDAAGPFAAGQALRARFALFMEFRDGRIVRQRNYDCFDPW